MSVQTKSNLRFAALLIGIVLSFVACTSLAIGYKKAKVSSEPKSETTNYKYLTFSSVDEADPVDVLKMYYKNPIKIDLHSEKMTIEGLKNKEVEKKINDRLASIENDEKDFCRVSFNVSNVLSINCPNDFVNFNLKTGDDIKIEEVFNDKTDLRKIMMDEMYASACEFGGCLAEVWDGYDGASTAENAMASMYKMLANGEYDFTIESTYLGIRFKDDDPVNDYYMNIPFYRYKDEVTIYDRFAGGVGYDETTLEKCNVYSCKHDDEKITNLVVNADLLNGRAILYETLGNSTNTYFGHSGNMDYLDIDIESFNEKLINKLFDEEKLDAVKDYSFVSVNANIYRTKSNYSIVAYTGYVIEQNKDEFENTILGDFTRKNKEYKGFYGFWTLKNGELVSLDSDPDKYFVNFKGDLSKYIRTNANDFGIYFDNDLEATISKIVKNTKVQIDLDANMVYMFSLVEDHSEEEFGILPFIEYQNMIPLSAFTLNQ